MPRDQLPNAQSIELELSDLNTILASVPDIFDTLEEERSKDIFDEIESEPVETVFTTPPPIPEGVPTQVTPEQLEQLYQSGELRRPPDWDAVRKRIGLRDEQAGLLGEAEGLATLEKAATVAQEPLIPAGITESAIALSTPALPPGVRRSVAEAASGLTSPVNIGMAVAGGGASAIPRIGGAVARGIAGGFAADIASHIPELGTVAGEASVTGTPEEQQKAIADIGLSALMGGLAGGGALARPRPAIPPRIVEAIAKADAIGLKRAAQAYADTVKQSQREAATTAVEENRAGHVTGAKIDQGNGVPILEEIDHPGFRPEERAALEEAKTTGKITVFRAVKKGQPLRAGDFITLRETDAAQYRSAADMEIISQEVPISDVHYVGDTGTWPIRYKFPGKIASKAKPIEKGIPDAIQEPPATEGLLRQERPEVGLQGVRQPQTETAIAREPARAQGGAQPEVLLTGPEVIKSIVELPDAAAGALRQKPAVEAGMKLTEADVPALEAARDSALKQAVEAAERGDNEAFKAGFGKNIWFSGAIEGARRKGPNYDTFIKELGDRPANRETGAIPEVPGERIGAGTPEGTRSVMEPQAGAGAVSGPIAPEAVSARPVSGEPAGRPAVGAAEAAASAIEAETQGAIATAGPPLMPVPPTGAPAPVKPISQIIRDLAAGLDVPIRFGRLTTSKYAGYFKKNPNLIGAKLANDMPIVAHEGGHKLDAIYPFTKDASLRPELEALGDPAIAGSRSSWTPAKSGVYKRSEGFAEFVRHWLTDPAEALRLAPDTHAVFERVLAANEDLGNVMRQAQSDIQIWLNAPQEGRLDSSISRSDPNKSRYRFPNLLRDVVDDLHFLRMAVDDAKVSGPLPPSRNPYQLARTLRGSFGMADTFIRKGITDFKTKEVRPGTGLEDALKPISGRMDEFRRWIVAKRAQELRGQGKETGLNGGDVGFVANKYNSEPAFQEAFAKVKAWNDGLLQYAVDSGLIDAGKAATATEPATGAHAMRVLHQDYVPFHRLFEVGAGESPAVAGGGAGRGLNAGKPGSLKRLSGSQRDIVDPLETMVKNAYTMITAAEKNAINTAVADLAPKTDMGRWVERVAAPKEMVRVELERIRKQLEDAGADLTAVPDDLLMGFFKPSGHAPFGENIIKVNRAGKQEFYRLDKELFDTFNALDQDASSRLLKLMSTPAQLLRAGVTLTPDFALSNAFRDTIGAAVLSKYTTYPFQATVRGIGAMLNDPKLVSEWAASGGKQSVEANYFDRAKLQKFLTEKITKDLTPAEQAMVVAKSPLTALRMITGTLEEATRIGEYKAALKKLTDEGMPIGDARRQAAFEARDLQDFAKGGAQTKIVRSLAAFWNAGLQGNVRLAQSFKQRPFQTTMKGLAFITLPKLLEQALNWNDEDYWDRPQWERDLFFMIPRGKDENGHTQFLRLPTPFEMGVIFGTVPGRILQTIREKDPKSLESLPGVMLRQTAPNPTPQSVLTLLEVNAGKSGYSFFRDRPIVPSSLKNAPPELQFTAQNSLTAKKVGRLLGVAPAKVDYAIGGLTGGVGRQLTHQVADRVISAATGEERTAQSTIPGARFVATPAGVQSESVERFYKALEEANADSERVKAGETSHGQAKRAPRLNVVARRISELRKQAREESNPQERQRINLRIAEIAKEAITP